MQRQVSKAQNKWEPAVLASLPPALWMSRRRARRFGARTERQTHLARCPQRGHGSSAVCRQRPSAQRYWPGKLPVAAHGNRERQPPPEVVQEVFRKACWMVGTNVLEPTALSDQALIGTYKDQGGVERGFRFLKDPL